MKSFALPAATASPCPMRVPTAEPKPAQIAVDFFEACSEASATLSAAFLTDGSTTPFQRATRVASATSDHPPLALKIAQRRLPEVALLGLVGTQGREKEIPALSEVPISKNRNTAGKSAASWR